MHKKLFMTVVGLSGVYKSVTESSMIWAVSPEEATGIAYREAEEKHPKFSITSVSIKEVEGLMKTDDVQHDMDLLDEYETLVNQIKAVCTDANVLKLIEEAGL